MVGMKERHRIQTSFRKSGGWRKKNILHLTSCIKGQRKKGKQNNKCKYNTKHFLTEKHEVCTLQKTMEPNGGREGNRHHQNLKQDHTFHTHSNVHLMYDITVQKLSTGHKRRWSMNGKKEEEEAGEDNTCFPLYPSSEVNVH